MTDRELVEWVANAQREAAFDNAQLLAMDRRLYGTSFVKDGKRVDPSRVSAHPETGEST